MPLRLKKLKHKYRTAAETHNIENRKDITNNVQAIMAEENKYELHECVFNGDVKKLSSLLRTHDISLKDKHGNTPLHIAVMLGHKECLHLLLAHGAPVKVKNSSGWSPLAEAISYGDRQIITALFRKLKQQAREQIENRRPDIMRALEQMGDFYMELKWDFQSWVPLVSRILPSDVCRIYKKGTSIRLDTTLVDFNDMKWERGDISFLFSGQRKASHSLTILDNKWKVFQKIKHEESDFEIEGEVDIMMSSDIVAAQMSMDQITFSRAQTGWIFRADKEEYVGKYNAQFHCLNGLTLISRKRREHLTDEDLQKNKAIMESLTKGGSSQPFDLEKEPPRRSSLDPPDLPKISWVEYISAEEGHPPHIGRPLVPKESSKSFKATVAMSEEFPLTVEKLLNVLEVIAPFKHFSKLRDFVQMKLPGGFPVKIEIPILPTVSAKITFQEFEFRNNLKDTLFEVPADYKEDQHRFPDL